MPYIRSPVDNCEIWYELVDDPPDQQLPEEERRAEAANADDGASTTTRRGDGQSVPRNGRRKRPRLVFIMGMGATSGCWGPQVDALARSGVRAQALLLDNRGVGKSGTPKSKRSYSTSTMARDVLACMDAVGWESAHLVGHSMGGMIAVKLASAAPKRVESLTIISATAGGIQIVPTAPRAIAYTLQLFFARSPAARAAVDLKLHFAPSTLDIHDATGGATRRELLHEEYVEGAKGGGAVGQSRQGFLGQLRAVWKHRVTRDDVALVRRSPFPVLVLHGRSDLLAPPKRGAALAARLGGAYVELEGAHFLTRERGPEVNALVRSVVGGDLAGSSAGNGDGEWCGGWAVPDPHRDLVPKQGWWRHRKERMNLHLRGSMTRLSSALSGAAGGSVAKLSAAASNAAAAAAAAMATTGAGTAEREIAKALSTPLVIDDANAETAERPQSPSPPPSACCPRSSEPLRYASSPEPWGAAARDQSPFPSSYEGAPGTVEWISPPGAGAGDGGWGFDDGRRGGDGGGDAPPDAVVLKGPSDPFASSALRQQQARHRRRGGERPSFLTRRCSTSEGTTPPPALASSPFASPARPNGKAVDDGPRRSPSPGAEPPMTPPSASRNGIGGNDGGDAPHSRSSFAFAKRVPSNRDVAMSDDSFGEPDDDGEDPRRNNSRCPFVDPVACSLNYRDDD